jgi:signal transduction histidine kinase/ligand-binding sensor domain-containing protein
MRHKPLSWVQLSLVFWVAACGFRLSVAGAEFKTADVARTPLNSYDIWQVEDGWVPNSVSSVLQSRDGYLWLGTYHGLVRFDGVRFTLFDSTHTQGLQTSRITALHEDTDGILWIGHETGELTRMADGKFYPANRAEKAPAGAIETIVSDANKDLWTLNEAGALFCVSDGRTLQTSPEFNPSRKVALSRDQAGRLWVVYNGLVSILEGGKLVPFEFPDAAPSDFYERIAPARDGALWVVGNGRIRKWAAGRWQLDLGDCPWGHSGVTALLETRSGALVAGTVDEGLYLLRPGAETLHFSRTNGLSHDWIRCLCEDREGTLWFGTGAGVNALRARKVKMLDAPDHWRGRAVLSFSVRPDGAAWIGTEGAGLYHFDKGTWTSYTESSGLSNLFIWSTIETRRGELFVGAWGGGCALKVGDHFESRGDLARITAPVVSFFEGQSGEVWIGTKLGVHRYEGGKLTWFAGTGELAFPDVRAITQTPDGTLWFGLSGGGLARLKEGTLKQFRKRDGLSSDFVQALYSEADGTLWIGTSDNGLARLKRGVFSSIGAEQGLPATVICHIVDDECGYLWFGSDRGVFRIAKTDLQRCADGAAKTVQCLSFGKAEGMASLICSGGFQPGACRTEQGLLWFPTAKGIAMIDPVNLALNQTPPPVVIEELRVEGQPVEINPAPNAPAGGGSSLRLKIAPGKQRFEIHYTALSFAAPEKVHFKYKLEGLERDWTDAGTKRVAPYSYLPPGDYSFHVIACNNDEIWNNTGASLSFSVQPQPWQTWWFKAATLLLGAVVVAGSVTWVIRRRVRRKFELLERQRALERERARIARDIHDDLGANLTHITLLSQSARGELPEGNAAAADLDQIYTTAREVTRAMDEIVWAVNPRHDTLDSLVAYLGRFGQTFLSGAGLRCRLDLPLHLPAWTLTSEIRHNVFLAFKEALHNIVKHAAATEVQISFERRPDGFMLLVADNGRGFDPGLLDGHAGPGADPARSSGGNGLHNMQLRLTEVGGRCEWDTAPREGTRVRLIVRIHSSL